VGCKRQGRRKIVVHNKNDEGEGEGGIVGEGGCYVIGNVIGREFVRICSWGRGGRPYSLVFSFPVDIES